MTKANETTRDEKTAKEIEELKRSQPTTVEQLITLALCVPLGDKKGNVHGPDCRWGLPLCLEGDPGIGKSDRIEAIGSRLGIPVATIATPHKQPEDFNGLRLPAGNGRTEVVSMLVEIDAVINAKEGIVFFDEISSAAPGTQAAMLNTILTGRVGGLHLGPKIRRVAAMNPVSSAAGGWGLEPPTANRFCHLPMPNPEVDGWFGWLLGTQSEAEDLEVTEDKVLEGWDAAWAMVVSQARGFMKAKAENVLFKMPAAGHEARSHAWASPRTWNFALRALATCRALHAPYSAEAKLLEGCIGEGAAGEFQTYMQKLDLPSPREVLDGQWRPQGKKLDVRLAAYTSTVLHVLGQRADIEKAKDPKQTDLALLWKRLNECFDEGGADYVAGLVAMLKPFRDLNGRTPDGVSGMRRFTQNNLIPHLTAEANRAG